METKALKMAENHTFNKLTIRTTYVCEDKIMVFLLKECKISHWHIMNVVEILHESASLKYFKTQDDTELIYFRENSFQK